MSQIRYTDTEINSYGIDLCFDGNRVTKSYNLDITKIDRLGYTTSDYCYNEKKAYESLSNVTYLTNDGREMNIIPNVYEIGKNYIIMEKYQTSFNNELVGGVEFWNCEKAESFDYVLDNYIRPIIIKLHQMGIFHNDIFARNIVMDFDENKCNIKRLAIIDFGNVSFQAQSRDIGEIMLLFKQDLLTSIPDLYN